MIGGSRPSLWPLALPVVLAAALASFVVLHPVVRGIPAMFWTFAVAAGGLLAWAAALGAQCLRAGRGLALDLALRRPHGIQILAQGTLIAWWGWWVRPVYEFVPFIAAQLIFAFALEALFALTRRGRHSLGFGPVPVVFSLNLFLWFHFQWFFFQMAMVLLVYVGKEFIRRHVGGMSRHIFNPSAFALAIAAVALIVTGQTGITQGEEIARSQFVPPHIFLVIFLVALPGQLLFGVAAMTMPAVLVIFGYSAVYFGVTGEYFFYDAYVPIAVFLGLHLLFTDPATSPRSHAGRVLFGLFYGSGVIASVYLLEALGAPVFYDKILPVPLLNLASGRLDRLGGALAAKLGAARAGLQAMPSPRARLALTGTWAAIFAAMSFGNIVGDHHPGQYYPFWRTACERGSDRACNYMGVLQQSFCDRGSGWGCNEFGAFLAEADANYRGAAEEFGRACGLGFGPGCDNLAALGRMSTGPFGRASPPQRELHIVLRGTKGPVAERDPAALRALACERGWSEWECP